MTKIVLAGATVLSDEVFMSRISSELLSNQNMVGISDADLKKHIGKRGIKYKDKVSRLALAASKKVMQQAQMIDTNYQDLNDKRCAVIASSCFGNLESVVSTAQQIRESSTDVLSPMTLPNVSANVMASTLAIWFGLRGANLFLTNGQTTGLDALVFANNLISKKRADRVLICCAESTSFELNPLFKKSKNMNLPQEACCCMLVEEKQSYLNRTDKKQVKSYEIKQVDKKLSPKNIGIGTHINGVYTSYLKEKINEKMSSLHATSGLLSSLMAFNYLDKQELERIQIDVTDNSSQCVEIIKS